MFSYNSHNAGIKIKKLDILNNQTTFRYNVLQLNGNINKAINSTRWSQDFLLFVAEQNTISEYFHSLNREAAISSKHKKENGFTNNFLNTQCKEGTKRYPKHKIALYITYLVMLVSTLVEFSNFLMLGAPKLESVRKVLQICCFLN